MTEMTVLYLTWHSPGSLEVPSIGRDVRAAIERAGHHAAGVKADCCLTQHFYIYQFIIYLLIYLFC